MVVLLVTTLQEHFFLLSFRNRLFQHKYYWDYEALTTNGELQFENQYVLLLDLKLYLKYMIDSLNHDGIQNLVNNFSGNKSI